MWISGCCCVQKPKVTYRTGKSGKIYVDNVTLEKQAE